MLLEILVPAAMVLALDQASKNVVAEHLSEGQCQVMGPLTIRHLRHRPGLQKLGPIALLGLWAALLGGALLLARTEYFFHNTGARIALGAALGGAASNVYDRLRLGAVIDFLDVGWWPVFNLADVAITVGAALALWFGTRP